MFDTAVNVIDIYLGLGESRGDFGQFAKAIKQIEDQNFALDYVKTAGLKDLSAGFGVAGDKSHYPLFETVNQRQSLNINRMGAQQLADRCELAGLIREGDCDLSLDMDFHSVGLRA